MMQIGDLVKYKKHNEGQRDKGVFSSDKRGV